MTSTCRNTTENNDDTPPKPPPRRSCKGTTPPPKPCATNPFLVGVIDAGTNDIAFIIYTMPDFVQVTSHHATIDTISKREGWYEQDPDMIMNHIYYCCELACNNLKSLGFCIKDIRAVGITNQRETTIVWDKATGKPLYNAILWKDTRSTVTVEKVLDRIPDRNKQHFQELSGLPISPYFTALKILWLKDNVKSIRQACLQKTCLAGTVDSWIVYNLTKGALHITDVTNASRTLLMNIDTLSWDAELCAAFKVDMRMLPKIRTCSENFGEITNERCVLHGVMIAGIIGNQQASLLGQHCTQIGQAKNTYRSGCFLLCNTGEKRILSNHGLLTTVAYKLGPQAPTSYALEGSVLVAGHALRWFQDQVRILPSADKADEFADVVNTTGDVYFVPAFTGLFAPYWRKDARGVLVGLTQFTTKNHVIRAALEAICFQTRDILEIMYEEVGFSPRRLHVDGKFSKSNLLMQLQADIADVRVVRSQSQEPSSLGAAMCAAFVAGIDVCAYEEEQLTAAFNSEEVFVPNCPEDERRQRYTQWKRAVKRSFNWGVPELEPVLKPKKSGNDPLWVALTAGIYLAGIICIYIISAKK